MASTATTGKYVDVFLGERRFLGRQFYYWLAPENKIVLKLRSKQGYRLQQLSFSEVVKTLISYGKSTVERFSPFPAPQIDTSLIEPA